MKRFWKIVAVEEGGIRLDGRVVRTPARAELKLPTAALAEAVAEEWRAQEKDVDPRTMPFTGFANAAIDRVAPDPATFARGIAEYGETDLLCYRADEPPPLVERQSAQWDPLLDWARTRYDIHFEIVTGIMHRAQPEATVARLGEAVAAFDAFRLAALQPLVTISGSLVTTLALAEGLIGAEDAFAISHLDELWQAEQWGEDWMATDQRDARRRDFVAAARFLALV